MFKYIFYLWYCSVSVLLLRCEQRLKRAGKLKKTEDVKKKLKDVVRYASSVNQSS